jgi:hypothetical protein
MSHTQVQWARGTSAQVAAYAGPAGEVVVDTDDYSLAVQDGATAGGYARLTPGILPPQGRLTLTSGIPVLSGPVAGAATVYYTPHVGRWCPIFNGAVWQQMPFIETSLALDATTSDPGYQASGSLYDIFTFLNAGVFAIGTGPAWSSTTARGSGAGTTQLQMLNGIQTNAVAITLRYGNATGNTVSVPANQATYLGTLYATANGQTTMHLQNLSGAPAFLGLYNAYNRVRMQSGAVDTTASWTYNSATYRTTDGNANTQINWVDGLQQSAWDVRYFVAANAGAGVTAQVGVLVSATSGTPVVTAQVTNGNMTLVAFGGANGPRLGLSYVQAAEAASGGAATFTAGTGPQQQGLRFGVDM